MKSKAGDSQDSESNHQHCVLPEFVTAHPHNLLAMIERPNSLPQVNKPMRRHRPDNYEYSNDVNSPERLAGFIEKNTGSFVDFYTGQCGCNAGMAFRTGRMYVFWRY